MPVPPKRLPFFKVGKELKELVNAPLAERERAKEETARIRAAERAAPDPDEPGTAS